MKIAVCYNRVPDVTRKGEAGDRISEAGAELQAAAVSAALSGLGHVPHLVPLGSELASFIRDLQTVRPAVVFNLCEGFWGDSRKEMHVAALLEMLGYAYTGASPFCLGLTQDKVRTKELLVHHQLPTPPYLVVSPGEALTASVKLTFPLIVKPRSEDASLGVTAESVVAGRQKLLERIAYIHATYRQAALVEEFIAGRELNVAVLGDGVAEVLPCSEIRFRPGLPHPIVSYAGKWLGDSPEYAGTVPVCPAPLRLSERISAKEVALRAYKVLECRDYARIDIRLRGGIPYILEINANPDISPDAGLARSARAAGLSYPQLIERILTMAVERKEQQDA
jgi:D-alanine-D-alanine ligase